MVEPVLRTMALILGAQVAALAALERATPRTGRGIWLAPRTNAPKRATELWFLRYAAVWIGAFALIIGLGLYERFTAWTYLGVCGGLALPLALQPFLYPGLTREADRPLAQRYALKANVWLAIFGWVGNYWYTHYFYVVLRANYTFDAHRLNDVPIALYLMTHAYFMFYHVLSNAALRKIRSRYRPGRGRFAFECGVIAAMSYSTAFMESLTICGFPYYSFEDRDMAYTLGSAFYGIYFLVSFPMFLRVDEDVRADGKAPSEALARALPAGAADAMAGRMTHRAVFWEAMGSGMAVLCMLDFVRVYLGIDFKMLAGGH